jgi:hypothetical protein
MAFSPADADIDVALAERLGEQAEQRHAALEQLEQRVELRDVLEAVLGQQAGGAVEVERVVGRLGQLGERGREARRGRRARWPAASVRQPGAQRARAEARARRAAR